MLWLRGESSVGTPPARTVTSIVPSDGSYTFATSSEHPSALHVEEQLVVDNSGANQPGLATGRIRLSRGVYRLEGKTYVVQDGDIMHILANR